MTSTIHAELHDLFHREIRRAIDGYGLDVNRPNEWAGKIKARGIDIPLFMSISDRTPGFILSISQAGLWPYGDKRHGIAFANALKMIQAKQVQMILDLKRQCREIMKENQKCSAVYRSLKFRTEKPGEAGIKYLICEAYEELQRTDVSKLKDHCATVKFKAYANVLGRDVMNQIYKKVKNSKNAQHV